MQNELSSEFTGWTHGGTEPVRFDTSNDTLSRELESERANERMSTAERKSEASNFEKANEWAAWANERTDEQVAQYLRPDSWLFWTFSPQTLKNGNFSVYNMRVVW